MDFDNPLSKAQQDSMIDPNSFDILNNIHNIKGPSALICQNLIFQAYSPLISIISSQECNELTSKLGFDSFLQLIKPFGNNLKGTFRIKNTQLITKTYNEFNLRFNNSILEILSLQTADNDINYKNVNMKILYPELFNPKSLELLMDEYIKQIDTLTKETSDSNKNTELKNSIYLKFFSKIISCQTIVPFETFNHPIAQIFTITSRDSLDSLKKLVVNFRNSMFPKFFNIEDLLIFIIIVHDNNDDIALAIHLQEAVKKNFGFNSSILKMSVDTDSSLDNSSKISIKHANITSIEEDLQNIQLPSTMTVKKLLPYNITNIEGTLVDFVNKYLIPFMERKISLWDDQIVAPRKSLTGKLFSVSKKIFNNSNTNTQNSSSNYNALEGYYHKNSPEQIIRKLGDWSFMLKDFKYSYQSYESLKKDFLNDKAWAYSASGQEISIIALLMGTSFNSSNVSQSNPLFKIKREVIEPYLDSLNYSYLSRTNLKTFSIKAILTIMELLVTNNLWILNDIITKWLIKLIELDVVRYNGRCLILERIGYVFCGTVHPSIRPILKNQLLSLSNMNINDDSSKKVEVEGDEEEEDFENPLKLTKKSMSIIGLTRSRKSAFWYLLASREWDPVLKPTQVELCINAIQDVYDNEELNWVNRDDELLGKIKLSLKGNS